MDTKIYEVISMAMRYVFTAIGVVLVWRAFSWLRKDRRMKHRRLRQLPDAGTIGIFTVMIGTKELPEGMILPVPHEGCIGCLRSCDVVAPADGVARQHADFTFIDGEGLYIFPRRHCEVNVDGTALRSRRDGLKMPMQHGSVLTIGPVTLQLGVFAGLNVQEVLAMPDGWAPDMVPPDPWMTEGGAHLGEE